MTHRLLSPLPHRWLLPLLILPIASLVGCGGGGPGEGAAEADSSLEAEAPDLPPGPPDGVALLLDDDALLERVRVSDGEARVIARREVPEGRLLSAVLAEADGRLVYSYELEVEGAAEVTRVVVDAVTARVVGRSLPPS